MPAWRKAALASGLLAKTRSIIDCTCAGGANPTPQVTLARSYAVMVDGLPSHGKTRWKICQRGSWPSVTPVGSAVASHLLYSAVAFGPSAQLAFLLWKSAISLFCAAVKPFPAASAFSVPGVAQ